METPAFPAPRDAHEREILANLESIRDRLLLLKQDRTRYIRSQDVLLLYDQTIEQVRLLRLAREGHTDGENRCQSFSIPLPRGDLLFFSVGCLDRP